MADPRRVLSFTGTIVGFLDYLDAAVDMEHLQNELLDVSARTEYEWELTASIARHPAGKGLRADG